MAPFFKETTRFFDLGTVEKLFPGDEHIMCKKGRNKSCVVAKIESDDSAVIETNGDSSLIIGERKGWFNLVPETEVKIFKDSPYKLIKKSAMVEGTRKKSRSLIWHK